MNPFKIENPFELKNDRKRSKEYHDAVDSHVGNLFQESELGHALFVVIKARQWWNYYGNPYMTLSVRVVDKEGISRWVYTDRPVRGGSGQYYQQAALDLLQESGIAPKTGLYYVSGAGADYCHFVDDIRNNPGKYDLSLAEVPRKKDL